MERVSEMVKRAEAIRIPSKPTLYFVVSFARCAVCCCSDTIFFLSSLPPCLKAMYTLPVPYVLAYLPLRLPCATALAHHACIDSFCLCVFNRQTIVRESGAARLPAIVCFSPFSHASFAWIDRDQPEHLPPLIAATACGACFELLTYWLVDGRMHTSNETGNTWDCAGMLFQLSVHSPFERRLSQLLFIAWSNAKPATWNDFVNFCKFLFVEITWVNFNVALINVRHLNWLSLEWLYIC